MRIKKIKFKTVAATFTLLLVFASACTQANQHQSTSGSGASTENSQKMNIKRSGSQTASQESPENFTGSVRVESVFSANEPSRV